jgi:Regulator of ribonuclease activity B
VNTQWVLVVLILVAAVSLFRIISQWRTFARRPAADWDEQFILQLRKAGVNAFEDQVIEFFFTLPTAQACEELRFVLAPDGFAVTSQTATESGVSVQLQRTMRLIVPDMQALTARLKQLAMDRGGTYDNWALGRQAA